MKEGHFHKYPAVYDKLLELINMDHFLAGFTASVLLGEYDQVTKEQAEGQSYRYWFGHPAILAIRNCSV